MVSFPNGKINLGLHVTGKRADGFHDIETVFYPIAIHDAVETIVAENLSFTSSGIVVGGTPENNLCLKAYNLLQRDHPRLPSIAIHLHKNIPIGAGLGGGSADAVAVLQLLNRLGNLGLSPEQFRAYALQLGSDCPFFLRNTPCFATGRGENLMEIDLDLSAYEILIVNPGIHINTGWAFSVLQTYSSNKDLQDILRKPIIEWKGSLYNDFEKVVFQKHPEIGVLKNSLYEQGAVYAALSGSGSTVYGLFEKNHKPDIRFPSYFVKWI